MRVIHVGDCLQVMRSMAENSVDAIVTDPPYGIGFMGKAWDGKDIVARMDKRRAMPSADPTCTGAGGHRSAAAAAGMYDLSPKAMTAFQHFTAEWCHEALRVLKPGGYLVSFASPRTYHRMACGIEEAGFELRDQIMWLFGSGFPKSHNGPWGGTALKPAHEPIAVARKPLSGTVAANWHEHGTGALNIDRCRVEPTGESRERIGESSQGCRYADAGGTNFAATPGARGGDPAGRWPANVIHDGSDEVVAAFPAAPGQQGDLRGHSRDRKSLGIYGDMAAARDAIARGDSGSAARFFYCAKASAADRDEGLEAGDLSLFAMSGGTTASIAAGAEPDGEHTIGLNRAKLRRNTHPTVKPTELMRYLCRLVTPAGGLVLDPFAGSGSTGKAAVVEGFDFVGIELDPAYAAIAEARIRAVQPGLPLGEAA